MTRQIEPSSRGSKTKLLDVNRSPNGFFQLSSQFLASTTANMTRDTYGRELMLFARWFGEDGNVSDIKLEHLLSYKVLLERQYSPATVSKKIAALKSFFGFAKRIEAIPNNPAEELRVAGVTKNRIPSHLTIEEVCRLIKMPDRRTLLGKRDVAIIALLANSGMRRSEVINLKIGSFIYSKEKHKQKERVYVKILGKGNKERMVMVHEDLVPLLGDWVRVRPEVEHDLFFTTKAGKPVSNKAIRYLIQKHGKAAGIPDEKLHPHSLRHSFCINLARAEVPLHIIQELSGHKTLNTLRIYLRVTQTETDEAIKKLPHFSRPNRVNKLVFG